MRDIRDIFSRRADGVPDEDREESAGKVRKRFVFSGRVQGVGFRYRAMYLARELGLTGWVCNLYNGDVEMELQGGEEEIGRLLGLLNGNGYIEITHIHEETIPLKKERGFSVRE